MKKLNLLLSLQVILFLIITKTLTAQSEEFPNSTNYSFYSEIFDEQRTISVCLPEGYSKENNKNYVTAYVFDGQFPAYFHMVNAMVNYYSMIGEAIPMIVVSIHSSNRSLELTPKWNNQRTYDGWRGNCGNADLLTNHLKNEVIPYIDSNYRTQKCRLGIGHSLGGTYVINEIFRPESIFTGVIAVSPNLVYDDEQLIEKGKQFVNNSNKTGFILASAGDEGDMEIMFAKGLEKLDSIFSYNKNENFKWETLWRKNNGHMETFLTSIDYGYQKFSEYWNFPVDAIDSISDNDFMDFLNNFYNQLSLFTGEKQNVSIDDLNSLAYALANKGQINKSLQITDLAIKEFPEDHNIHDTKGEILEMDGQFSNAKNSYKAALKVLNGQSSGITKEDYEYFKSNYENRINRLSDDYIEYKELIKKAKNEAQNINYKLASDYYSKAFKIGIIRATHIDRKNAAGTYAQAGRIDDAFEKLFELANTFKWRGSETFESDNLLDPLKTDKRWEKFISLVRKNETEQ